MLTFSKDCKITQLATVTAGASGTADITSSSIDTSGFEGVCFIVGAGALHDSATVTIHVQQSTDDSSFASLASTYTTSLTETSDDNKSFYIDIKGVTERYLRVLIDRDGTNACTFGAIYAVQYNPRNAPVTQGTNVSGSLYIGVTE